MFYWIISAKDIDFVENDFNKVFLQFMFYILSVCLLTLYVTKRAKEYIQDRNWDIDYYSLRNTNYWYHILSARYLNGRGVQGSLGETDIIVVDVLTDKQVLYTGILLDFNYSPQKDELENIILGTVLKRNWAKSADDDRIDKDEHSTGKPSKIPGDVFVIPAKQILNLNIHYLKLGSEISVGPSSTLTKQEGPKISQGPLAKG
ncbi:hypothetical protein FPE01S_02_09230 [Flavihumibacter petaseus NBRC 106054]|uniref:Uncharacterized protein n=2 Tax=Flavihumibacter TaxID=1004301 RepID=A0A0E9N1B1_9BACT|nr:hypothetical protein FPE01S_02_09230 [Flavihumibacter petaseus NBRC 106054]